MIPYDITYKELIITYDITGGELIITCRIFRIILTQQIESTRSPKSIRES